MSCIILYDAYVRCLMIFTCFMILDNNLYSSLDSIFFQLFFLGPEVFSPDVEAMLIMLYYVYDYNVYVINTVSFTVCKYERQEWCEGSDDRLLKNAIKVHKINTDQLLF